MYAFRILPDALCYNMRSSQKGCVFVFVCVLHVVQEGERGVVIHTRILGSVNHQLALSTLPTIISRNVEYKKEEKKIQEERSGLAIALAASGFSNVIFNDRICMLAQLPASRSIPTVLGMAPANSIRLTRWSVFQRFLPQWLRCPMGRKPPPSPPLWVCLSVSCTLVTIELCNDMAVSFCRQDPFSASSGVFFFFHLSSSPNIIQMQLYGVCVYICRFTLDTKHCK